MNTEQTRERLSAAMRFLADDRTTEACLILAALMGEVIGELETTNHNIAELEHRMLPPVDVTSA